MSVPHPLPEHASASSTTHTRRYRGQDTDLRTSAIITAVSLDQVAQALSPKLVPTCRPMANVTEDRITGLHRSTSPCLTQISLPTPIIDHSTRHHPHERQPRTHSLWDKQGSFTTRRRRTRNSTATNQARVEIPSNPPPSLVATTKTSQHPTVLPSCTTTVIFTLRYPPSTRHGQEGRQTANRKSKPFETK